MSGLDALGETERLDRPVQAGEGPLVAERDERVEERRGRGAPGNSDADCHEQIARLPATFLGEGTPSQEALDWVTVDHSDWARIKQHVVSAYLSGDSAGFFELPGGPIGFALGAEYRKESSN